MVILTNQRFTSQCCYSCVGLKPFIRFSSSKSLCHQVSVTEFLQVKCQFQVGQCVLVELLLITSKSSEQY